MSDDIPEIGMLRDRVALFRRDQTAEPEGGFSSLHVPLATIWARVHARPAGFAAFADARGVRATHSVVLRYRTDLVPGDRIVWRGRRLDILSVDDLNGRRAYMTCACAETEVTA